MLLRFRTMHIGVALAGVMLSLLVATDAANPYFGSGLSDALSLAKTTFMQRCC